MKRAISELRNPPLANLKMLIWMSMTKKPTNSLDIAEAKHKI